MYVIYTNTYILEIILIENYVLVTILILQFNLLIPNVPTK